MNLAPIVLFAYKRPKHTLATLTALSNNTLANGSDLYIFIDGLKENASEQDKMEWKEVVEIANSKNWCNRVEIKTGNTNKGLADSVIEGVSQIIKKKGKVIVLEDDLITSPLFLEFMNKALDIYETKHEVACISGYVYPLTKVNASAFFVKGADCWGWATWEDKWKMFRNEPKALYNEITGAKRETEFDFNKSYPYMQMLKDRQDSKNQSWAILWYASAFLKNMQCLYPPKSFIQNIGNDGSGTHNLEMTTLYDGSMEVNALPVFPSDVKESSEGRAQFELFFMSLKSDPPASIITKLKNRLKKILNK